MQGLLLGCWDSYCGLNLVGPLLREHLVIGTGPSDGRQRCSAGPGNMLGIAESLSYLTLSLGAVVLTLQVRDDITCAGKGCLYSCNHLVHLCRLLLPGTCSGDLTA